jgi:hypothetical protein
MFPFGRSGPPRRSDVSQLRDCWSWCLYLITNDMDTRTNHELFCETLTAWYIKLFFTDPEYAYVAGHTSPAALAEKMTADLASGGANKDGAAIRGTCKTLGIPHTDEAIRAYLASS